MGLRAYLLLFSVRSPRAFRRDLLVSRDASLVAGDDEVQTSNYHTICNLSSAKVAYSLAKPTHLDGSETPLVSD